MTRPGGRVGEQVRRGRALEATVLAVFEGWDYEAIVPPLFGYADLFAGAHRASDHARRADIARIETLAGAPA